MSVVVIGIIVTVITMPSFMNLLQVYRRDSAVGQIAGDVRKARIEAIRTGWQYRVYGFNAGSSSAYKNKYRLMARSSGGVSWAADSAAPFQSATQMAGPWVDVGALFKGVTMNPTDASDHFWVTFDSRGVRIELDASFDPMMVKNTNISATKSLRVTTAGTVKIQ
jgi:Tfp pilus assembly protein FimT